LHDPRRLLTPGIRTQDRLQTLEDEQELRRRLDPWHPAFRSLSSKPWLACSLLVTGKSSLHVGGKRQGAGRLRVCGGRSV